MPYTDLPIDQLRSYTPDPAVPSNLDSFWADTLEPSRSRGISRCTVAGSPRSTVDAGQVSSIRPTEKSAGARLAWLNALLAGRRDEAANT
jgi:hypothetical protein